MRMFRQTAMLAQKSFYSISVVPTKVSIFINCFSTFASG